MPNAILKREFFVRETRVVAQELLGKWLVRELNGERISGWIVEVEAYLASGDEASHAFHGIGRKNRSMFLDAGHLYVYSIHGRCCLNVVTQGESEGTAVLIRALEPMHGIETMRRHRQTMDDRLLTRGPARLCQALGVDRSMDGVDLTRGEKIWLEMPEMARFSAPYCVRTSTRIGIRRGTEFPWRYFLDRNYFVSGPAAVHSALPRQRIQCAGD